MQVPKNLFLDIIGRERVMNFVIREIVTSAVAGYVEEASIHGLNESTYEHDLIRDKDYLYFSL